MGPLEQYIWYRKLMFYHNIINSKDTRLAKIVWMQQFKYDMPNTFHSNTQVLLKTLNINGDPSQMPGYLKSTWKELVKSAITNYILLKFQPKLDSMTKLRFIKDDLFER